MILLAGVAAAAPWVEPALVGGVWSYADWDDPTLFDALSTAEVRVIGDEAAIVNAQGQDWLVTEAGGVERVLARPPGARWVGLGTGASAYALADGHVLRDGVDTRIVGDRADAVPGYLIVGQRNDVTVYAEPSLERLGHAEGAGPVFVTTEGVAVVVEPESLKVFFGGTWSRVERPAGAVVRVGAQIQVVGTGLALDSARTGWNSAGQSGGFAWWSEQVGVSRNPHRQPTTASHATVCYPTPPAPKSAPRSRESVQQKSLLLQMIGTAGTTIGEVRDFPGDNHDRYVLKEARVAAPGRTDVLFLADGRFNGGAGGGRPPHALLLDRQVGSTELISLPPDCAPIRAAAHRGLVSLWCARGDESEVFAWTGSTWRSEGWVSGVADTFELRGGEDGTLLLDRKSVLYMRSPSMPGEGRWYPVQLQDSVGVRIVSGGVVVMRTPGVGRVAFEYRRDGKSTLLFEGAAPPGRYDLAVRDGALELWSVGWDGYESLAPTRVPLPK